MTTIKLKVKQTKSKAVEAEAGSAGNIIVSPGTGIDWQGTGSHDYRVTFRDLDTGAHIWPFSAPSAVGSPPALTVGQGTVSTQLKSELPPSIKYEVEAVDSADVDALDPMIIIRPLATPVSSNDDVTLGVVAAVVGAIAGAAITAMML